MRFNTLNDEDRRQWVQNDEGLYRWWQGSGIGLYRFVRENRDELTTVILAALNREPVY
jgi:hypothetical protein